MTKETDILRKKADCFSAYISIDFSTHFNEIGLIRASFVLSGQKGLDDFVWRTEWFPKGPKESFGGPLWGKALVEVVVA